MFTSGNNSWLVFGAQRLIRLHLVLSQRDGVWARVTSWQTKYTADVRYSVKDNSCLYLVSNQPKRYEVKWFPGTNKEEINAHPSGKSEKWVGVAWGWGELRGQSTEGQKPFPEADVLFKTNSLCTLGSSIALRWSLPAIHQDSSASLGL